MADAFISSTVSTNGFGDIFIGQTANDVEVVNEYYSRYLRGVPQPLSVLNMQSVFNRLPAYDGASLNTLSLPSPWEDVNTEAYLNAKEDFNAHVFWLWGSLDTGGCFFCKNAEGTRLFAGINYGWFKQVFSNDPEVYKYCYALVKGGVNDSFTFDDCSQVAISFTGEISSGTSEAGIISTNPTFNVFSHGIGSPTRIRDVVETPIEPLPQVPPFQIASYPNVRTGSLIEAVANTAYDNAIYSDASFNNYVPQRIWLCTRKQSIQCWYQNTTIYEKQGSWSGGKSIDTGIDPYSTGQPANASGEKGSYPTKSDTTLPTNPNASGVDAIGTGFVTLYNPSVAQVKAFNDYLFDGSITEAMANGLKKLIADPIDYLVFIAMVHFAPTVDLTSQEITFCGLSSGVFSKIIPSGNQFQVLDYGDIVIDEPTCSFMDYSPLCKASIFIPYVGFRDLPIDDIMGGGSVNLKYHVDLLTGAFIAQVSVKRPTRSQFPGDAHTDGG